jgi:hypothetical protein
MINNIDTEINLNKSDINIDTIFGKYILDNKIINWYLNYRDDIKTVFNELINISYDNDVNIENNTINVNTFIITLYNESHFNKSKYN